MNLDRLDRRLLHELDRSARISAAELGRKLRLGSDLVDYRIRRFVKDGIIARFSPVIDPGRLGLTIYKTYVRHRMRGKILRGFLKRLETHPALYWLVEGYGEWDMMFSLGAKTPVEYQNACDEIFGWAEDLITDSSVATLVCVRRFPKHYLVGRAEDQLMWGNSVPPPPLDGVDRGLLAQLSINARQSVAELARQIGTTEAIVRYRLKQLESSGIILGFRLQFDYEQLGMLCCKVFVETRSAPLQVKERIREYCRAAPHITCVVDQIGESPLEFEVEVEEFTAFAEHMDHFQEHFGADVGRISYMILRRDHYHRVPLAATAG